MKHADPRAILHLAEREQIRSAIEARIERWIDLLDHIEGDPDLESNGDDEESLGWSAGANHTRLGHNTADGDSTAPERHGGGFVRCSEDDVEDVSEDEGADIQAQCHDADPEESSLGSLDRRLDQAKWSGDGGFLSNSDLELDRSDYEKTAPERHGMGFLACGGDDVEEDGSAEPDARFTPKRPQNEDGYGVDAPTPIAVDQVKGLSGLYAMVCAGRCLEPLVASHSKLVMNPAVHPMPGDLVNIFVEQDGVAFGLIKRLIHGVPPKFSADSEIEAMLTVEQLNPARILEIAMSRVVAVHKVVGEKLEDGRLDDRLLARNTALERVRNKAWAKLQADCSPVPMGGSVA